MKICMFVRNVITLDSRVKREALALHEAGHSVTVVGIIDRNYPTRETWRGVQFERIRELPRFLVGIYVLIKMGLRIIGKCKQIVRGAFSAGKKADLEKAAPPLGGRSSQTMQRTLPEKIVLLTNHFFSRRKLLAGLAEIAEREKFDVFHAHDLNTLEFCGKIARRHNAKLVYDSHELCVEWAKNRVCLPQPIVKAWEKNERYWSKHANLVVTVCDGLAKILQEEYNLPTPPLVVYNAERYHPREKTNVLRDQFLHTAPERRIVLYQGTVANGRGLEELCQMATFLPELDFVIIGSAAKTYKNFLLNLTRDQSNVFILDPVPYDDLWELTCSANVGYVCTEPICRSYELAVPNKMFQFMCAGLAILASDTEGHRELLGKVGEGIAPFLLVPYRESEKAATMLRELLEDGEKLDQMAERGHAIARDLFNAELEMKKLVAAYETLDETKS